MDEAIIVNDITVKRGHCLSAVAPRRYETILYSTVNECIKLVYEGDLSAEDLSKWVVSHDTLPRVAVCKVVGAEKVSWRVVIYLRAVNLPVQDFQDLDIAITTAEEIAAELDIPLIVEGR